MPKVSAEDQVVTGTRLSNGSKITIPCPAGTDVTFSISGMHYNRTYIGYSVLSAILTLISTAHYWDSPHEFRPDRFLGDWPKDAFAPFAIGTNTNRTRSLDC